jgi:hypothetical protein
MDGGDEAAASARLVAIALKAMDLFHAPDKIRYGRVLWMDTTRFGRSRDRMPRNG